MTLKRMILVSMVVLTAGLAWATIAITQDSIETSRLVVQVDQGEHRISPEIYGHFAEHLGRCVYEGFWVGPDSNIPNIRGIRTDVVEALKKMKVPVLRWPGGCFADEYHWKEGVGPREKRGRMINTHWGGVIDDNSFGTHEFMDLCEMLGSEAYIAGNVGSGTVEELQDWVEYMTSDKDSDMANWRRANGREKPWKVKYIGIGNENWGCGGNMTPEYYSDLYRRYQTYVRSYSGNEIVKVGSGPGGIDTHWTDVVMERAGQYMNAIGQHYYVRGSGTWDQNQKGSATEFDEREWAVLMKHSLDIDDVINGTLEIMNRHDPRGLVDLYIDEWGTWWNEEPGTHSGFLYQQNTLRDAVSAAIFLNIFNRHCDRVKMCNIAQINNVLQAMILTRGPEMIVTPTYHVFEMFNVHHGATLLPQELSCPTYRGADDNLSMLVSSVSKNDAGTIHITVCNLNPNKDAPLECVLEGVSPNSVTGRVLTSGKITDHNTFENPDIVKPAEFTGASVDGNRVTATIPAKSVVVMAVK
jgi:alpha-N-arabinofuranosidase